MTIATLFHAPRIWTAVGLKGDLCRSTGVRSTGRMLCDRTAAKSGLIETATSPIRSNLVLPRSSRGLGRSPLT